MIPEAFAPGSGESGEVFSTECWALCRKSNLKVINSECRDTSPSPAL